MCVFLSVYKISSQNNASIFNFRILFDRKVNLVSALGLLKFSVVFKRARKKQKEIKKTWIFTENWFLTKSILVFGVTLKQITVYAWNIHWMFVLAFSLKHQIIFWLVFSCSRTLSVSNFFSFFSINVNKILYVCSKSVQI